MVVQHRIDGRGDTFSYREDSFSRHRHRFSKVLDTAKPISQNVPGRSDEFSGPAPVEIWSSRAVLPLRLNPEQRAEMSPIIAVEPSFIKT